MVRPASVGQDGGRTVRPSCAVTPLSRASTSIHAPGKEGKAAFRP